MRKILISILVILLLVLAYFTIFQGIALGNFKILNVEKIIELNNTLNLGIEEANSKIKNDLKNKQKELSENVEVLSNNKEEYYKLANVSTENEIDEANTQEIYNSEYLWIKIGRHARKEKVIPKMDVKTSTTGDSTLKDLAITAEGSYYGIIDFVSDLENDSDLNFRIENFKLIPSGDDLLATFNVSGLKIKIENTTQTVSENNTSTTQTSDTNNVQ